VSTKSSTSATATPDRRLEGAISGLPGVAPATAKALAARGLRSALDLLLFLPSALVDLTTPLEGDAILSAGRSLVAIRGVVEKASIVPMRGRRAIRVAVRSGRVLVELWWFFFAESARKLAGEITILGVPSVDAKKPGVVRVVHPKIAPAGRLGLEPIYTVPGVSSSKVADAARAALELASDDLDPTEKAGFAALLHEVHAPTSRDAHLAAREEVRRRLAFGEAAWLVARRLERERAAADAHARRIPHDRAVEERLFAALGFELTGSQRRAIEAISTRLSGDRPTRTLLTGDVGTGKTAVLLAAAAQVAASGAQVAILAPTTILAEQYLAAMQPLRAIGLRVGSDLGDQVVVGTHALLSERVEFRDLALAIVDEQHRLGVGQRLALVEKGNAPHLVTVSATPIPRTFALALRGEIENVHLDERPRGRTTPSTRVMPRTAWPEVLSEIEATLARGERVFVVCARIEEDDEDTRSGPGAIAREKELKKRFRSVALVHGAMREDEARTAVSGFRSGDVNILVGTSILEVGIDVPEATLLVVDGADRFGLAQLHQLRGRVGRGDEPGRALLVHDPAASELAQKRLAALSLAADGLAVARADLSLRGAGDLDGARQSGEASGLRWLDPLVDEDLAGAASSAAEHPSPALLRLFCRLDGVQKKSARGDAG
jgi:ATP-dependent DNA helicase RecG